MCAGSSCNTPPPPQHPSPSVWPSGLLLPPAPYLSVLPLTDHCHTALHKQQQQQCTRSHRQQTAHGHLLQFQPCCCQHAWPVGVQRWLQTCSPAAAVKPVYTCTATCTDLLLSSSKHMQITYCGQWRMCDCHSLTVLAPKVPQDGLWVSMTSWWARRSGGQTCNAQSARRRHQID
jgi:hypothetical protein